MSKTAALTSLQEAKNLLQGEIEKLRQQAAEKKTLIGQYSTELNALRDAPIGFDDYADYVRQNMRAAAASIPGPCSEGLLNSSGSKSRMDARGWAYFEDSFEDGVPPNVWQNSFEPISIATGTVRPWVLLCYLGGQKFEDDVINGLRNNFASRWGEGQSGAAEPYVPVEQRRIRCGELNALIETENAALQAIYTELDGLVSVVE